jgi:hypothetical protein
MSSTASKIHQSPEDEETSEEAASSRLISPTHPSLTPSLSFSSFPPVSPLIFSPNCGCFEAHPSPCCPFLSTEHNRIDTYAASSLPPFICSPIPRSLSRSSIIPSLHSSNSSLYSFSSSSPAPSSLLVLLPPEMVHHVLGFLDVPSLASCYSVCHSWRALLRSATLWRSAYLALWTRSDAALHRATQRTIAEAIDEQARARDRRDSCGRRRSLSGGGTDDDELDEGYDGEGDDVTKMAAGGSRDCSDYDNENWRQGWRWRQRVREERREQAEREKGEEQAEAEREGSADGLLAFYLGDDDYAEEDGELQPRVRLRGRVRTLSFSFFSHFLLFPFPDRNVYNNSTRATSTG